MADEAVATEAATTTEQETTGGATTEGASAASGADDGADTTDATQTETTTEDQQQDGQTNEGADATKDGDPAPYELTLPEDSTLDDAALERIAATARARGLSQEQAQSVVELANGEVQAATAALLAAHQPGGAVWAKQVEQWKADALADAALGKTPEERTAAVQRGQSVMAKYAEMHPDDAPAMTEFLNDSGLGNHPAAVRFFAWIGRSMSEGTLAMPGTQGSDTPEDRARRMYPTMQSK
jgi:hypothetical protein